MSAADERQFELVRKLRKLRALSNSSNEHEAALAAAKLQELMTRYRIAELELAETEQDAFMKGSIEWRSNGAWRQGLLNTVARVNGCRAVLISTADRRTRFAIVGREHMVPVIEETFFYLADEIERLSLRHWHLTGIYTGEPSRRWRAGFCVGASAVVIGRLHEAYRSATTTPTGVTNALIVRDEEEVKRALGQFFPHLRSVAQRTRTSSGAGYATGRQAGASIGLSRPGRLTGRLGIAN